MNDNYTHTELLIQYLDGELPPSDAEKLEQELSGNQALQDEMESLRLSRLAISGYGLKQEIANLHFEAMKQLQTAPQRSKVRSIVRITMRVAASIIFILFAAGVYEYATISSKGLFNQQYSSFSLPVSRGGETESSAQTAFRQKDYDKVINIVEAEKSNAGYSPVESFLAAQSYLAKNETRNAIFWFEATLEKNLSFQTSIYQDDAEYFLALCYLQDKQIQKAWPLFQKINDNKNHLYHDKVNTWFMARLQLLKWKK
jgi:tetratricopeptide (TPR) repeat protein